MGKSELKFGNRFIVAAKMPEATKIYVNPSQ